MSRSGSSIAEGSSLSEDEKDAILATLKRLTASPQLKRSRQLVHFLEFTIRRCLEGSADELKEYTIGVEVFGRDASFDPKIDPIVRTEARRLRRKLKEFYESGGAQESIRIEYPTGGYAPSFVRASSTEDRPSRRTTAWAFVTFALLAIVAGAVLWRSPPSSSVPPSPHAEPSRIAVLPFADFSPEGAHLSIAPALTEALITRLAKLGTLNVISRTSVMQVETTPEGLSGIANLLGADYIVEGSVVRSENQSRVSAQLIRARDDVHLWAGEFDVPSGDVLRVTREVGDRIVAELRLNLSDEKRVAFQADFVSNPSAFESFARGQYFLQQFNYRRLPPHAAEAEALFKRALELDPDYVDAMVALGTLYSYLLSPPQGDPRELVASAERYLEEALSRRPNDAAALALLGSMAARRGERVEGLRLSLLAVETDPADPRAHHHLGTRLGERGFYEAALLEHEEALRLDPLEGNSLASKIWLLSKLGRHQEALAAFEGLLRIEPDGAVADLVLGSIYFEQGDLATARWIWTARLEIAPEDVDVSYLEIALALVDAREGEEETARRVAARYRESPPRSMDHLIQLFALVGENEMALEHIRRSSYYSNYRWVTATASLETLHRDPDFRALLDDLYQQWQKDLIDSGAQVRALPEERPSPEVFLRS